MPLPNAHRASGKWREEGRMPRQRRRLLAGAFLLGVLATARPLPVIPVQAASNPIVTENQLTGSSAWQFSGPVSDDATGQVQGYASATSVGQTQSIIFYVSVNPVQTYSIDFYRIGWYSGAGGRLRLHVGPQNGVRQPGCPRDATTGMVACNWSASYTLTVPADWTSGIYFGVLTNASGYQSDVMFVVRDGRPAPFLYQQSVTTDEAYNNYPADGSTGKSLYEYNSYGPNTVAGTVRAVKVSFDRPYMNGGTGNFMNWEIEMVRWLERSGYDVTYATNIDTHTNAAMLRNSKAFLSVGHDEYWSKAMLDGVTAARDAGVSLGFFGANPLGWQIRLEPSAGGVANRIITCYKDATVDPVQGATTTVEWANPLLSRPEQILAGTQFTSQLTWGQNAGYVVSNSSNWVYAGTGFRDGDVVPGLVGYEVDRYMSNLPAPTATSRVLLSQSPVTNVNGVADVSNSSIYQAPSKAWVFATGTMSWGWGLDNYDHVVADARIQLATANVLNTFLNGTVQPPALLQLSAVQATSVGATSATITWQSNNPATSQVNFGPTTSYGRSASDASSVTGHSVVLAGLTASTTYHFQVSGTDIYGQSATGLDGTFTTTAPPLGWTWVRGSSGADSAISGTTFSVAITAPARGNFLALSSVVVDYNNAGTPTITSITDNGSPASVWAKAIGPVLGGLHASGGIWYAANVAGAPTTITLTISPGGSSAPDQISRVDEYSGIATSTPLDQATGREVDGVTAVSPGTTGATTVDQELAIAVYGDNNQGASISSPSGWSERRNSSSLGHRAGEVAIDKAVPTGTQSATFTSNYGTYALAMIATFKLGAPPIPLQLNTVQAGSIGASSAVISWTSTNPANGRVDYGPTTAYGSLLTNASMVSGHSMTLNGLASNTNYHFKVTSVDNYGQTASSADASFTTSPPPALQLNAVQAGSIGASSVTISWTSTNPASSRVDYGTTTAYGSVLSDATVVSNHSLTLSGLASNTTYHFNVTSVDGFTQTASSTDATFSTLAPPALQLSAVQAGTITTSSAVITWTTTNPASSRVDYGPTATYGSVVSDTSLVPGHSITLTGLASNAAYHYRVTSVDGFAQTASSTDMTVTTLPPPALQLSAVQAGTITMSSAVISWTSTNPANSRVDYGATTAYGSVVSNAGVVTAHAMTLATLASGNTYHYKVTSVDNYGQTAISTDAVFATTTPPTGWSWVKGSSGPDSAISGTSFTVNITAPVRGNFLVLSSSVIDYYSAGTPSIASITDNGSPASTWRKAVAVTAPGLHMSGEIWYATNVTGAPTTITVTINPGGSSAADQISRVDEYSGITSGAPLDKTTGQEVDGVTACPTGATAATTVDKELAVAIYGDNNQGVNITSPPGWTQRRNSSSWAGQAGLVVIDRSVPVGTQSATFASDYGTYAMTAIATFRPGP
jgi:hypothetical protein